MNKKIFFISNWTQGYGMSGGDRIWIEFAKEWKNKISLALIGSEESIEISKRYGLQDTDFLISMKRIKDKKNLSVLNLIKNITKRTFQSYRFIKKNGNKIFSNSENQIIYSVSDFWPDFLMAFLIKKKFPKIKWIAGFFLFAPLPWKKGSPYKGVYAFKGFLYYLIQRPAFWIIKKYADIVFVTSEPDIEKFVTKKRSKEKIIIIQGGVDVTEANKYFQNKISNLKTKEMKSYDACFLGRFHHQKGVLELIDIWKIVCQKKNNAKLVIIGNGELEKNIKEKTKKLNLTKNIEILGFLDGQKKYEIFKKSKIMVHPATYDSGGMAAAEGMAWGLPGVSFDLEALKTYYPKGMLKTKPEDYQEFAKNILQILNNKDLYKKLSNDARNLILEVWDWKKRAIQIFNQIK